MRFLRGLWLWWGGGQAILLPGIKVATAVLIQPSLYSAGLNQPGNYTADRTQPGVYGADEVP